MTAPDPRTPVTLRDPSSDLELTVLPHAGMLISSLRSGGAEWLGQRRGVDAYIDAGKTMGIPLLYPWANRLSEERFTVGGVDVDLTGERPGLRRDPNGYPIHGLLAAHPGWEIDPPQIAAGQAAPAMLTARFDFAAHPELLASFPFPHTVEYVVAVGARKVTLQLTVRATGDVPVPVAHGLHPYLTLPGAPRETWRIERPAMDHLQLDDHGLPTGAFTHADAWDGLLEGRVFDDAYAGVDQDDPFVVEGGDARISTTFTGGYRAAQVFAPAEDEVICFEPMAAPTNALVTGAGLRLVEPGAEDVCGVQIELGEPRRG